MPAHPHASQRALHVGQLRDGVWSQADDPVAIEEPLEIRLRVPGGVQLRQEPITVTMRTPGNDFELAAGFLYGEGIVHVPAHIEGIDYCGEGDSDDDRYNRVLVALRPGMALDFAYQKRNFTTTSACGVCGKASLDALVLDGCRPLTAGPEVTPTTLTALPAALRDAQRAFEATGGVHASALFTPGGDLVSLREDVGRHNAFDKLVGERFLADSMAGLAGMVAVLSGRASYELLQKAVRARIPVVAAVGAPSSLAVAIAETFNITLVGFLKPGGFNVYAGRERIL